MKKCASFTYQKKSEYISKFCNLRNGLNFSLYNNRQFDAMCSKLENKGIFVNLRILDLFATEMKLYLQMLRIVTDLKTFRKMHEHFLNRREKPIKQFHLTPL